MDKNKKNTSEPRFSLSVTQVQNPIAESTCLNLNGTRSVPHFQWGGTPLIYKNRSNSSSCLMPNDKTVTSNASRVCTTNPQQSKTSSRIDPRIYADVQSKGLASRIVKYHDKSSSLNRSMSLTNLYSKPCNFPVVHLKKTDMPYKATQQTLSMTRIAPPQKSMFYGNTLSSLLRSNSVVGLHKSDLEISHENRPIMHPPVTESELAPTRSVLDVLKEISRKRISSDQLDSNELAKKYCNRDSSSCDVVNTVQGPQGSRSTEFTQSYKRQREHHNTSPQNSKETHTSSTGTGNLREQLSPEQIAKKRVCNYNNDITSSLSSSLIQASKRKSNDQRYGLNSSNGSNLLAEDKRTHKAKLQCRHSELPLPKTLTCDVPITANQAKQLNPTVQISHRAASLQPIVMPPIQAISVPVRAISTPVNITSNESGPVFTPATNKPRLTLFNKKYDECTEIGTFQKTDDITADSSEYGDVLFVKPKKSSSITNTKNPLIERTQKSKLALMLSALRGELYQGDEDEVDTHSQLPREKRIESNLPSAFTTSSVVASNPSSSTTTILTTTTTTTSVTNTKSSIIGITTLKSANVANVPVISTTISATTTPAVVTTTASVGSSSSVGGFKFIPPISTSLASSPPSKTKMTSPLVGIKLTPQTSPTMLTATSSTPAFFFGTPTSSAVTSSNTATSAASAFSFGTPATSTVASSNTITSASPAFSFGTPTTSTAASAATAFSFGTPTTSPATSTNTATSTAPMFSFGAPASSAVTSSEYTSKSPAVPTLSGFTFSNGTFAKPAATPIPTQSTDAKNDSLTFTSSTNNISTTDPATTTSATTFKSNYSFGSTTTPIIAPTVKLDSAAPSLSSSSNASSFNTATASIFVSATNAPILGSITSPSTTTTSTAFGNTNNATAMTQAVSQPFSLPSETAAENKSTAPANIFGGSSNTLGAAKPFAFGCPNPGLPAATNITASATNTSASTIVTSGFTFNTPTQKPLAAAAPFSFGGTTETAAAPVKNSFAFGGVTPLPTTAPNFGSGLFGKSAATNISNSSTNNSFAPNAGITNSGFGQVSKSVFGTTAAASTDATNATNTTTASTQSASNFIFGSTTTFAQPTKLTTFGPTAGSSTPFAHGGSTTSPASAAFTFGGVANEPAVATRATNIFDSTTAITSVPTTGVVKPSFSFGGGSMLTMNPSTNSTFSGVTTSADANNSFRPLEAAANATQSKSFGFGASSSSVSSMPTTNVFRASPAPNNTKSALGNFSFGNATNNTAFTSNNNAAADGTFQFSSASTVTPETTTTNKPFTFGNITNTNSSGANGPNMFGAASQLPPNTNPFSANIPPSDGRLIRRATRRLHKS